MGSDAIILPDEGQASVDVDNDLADEAFAFVGRSVAEVERLLIVDTLAHTFGNRTHAATILGISIRTLRNKLKQYGDEGMTIPSSSSGTTDFAVSRP